MTDLLVNMVGSTGAGGRLLVLIHGYGADEYDLAPLAPALDPAGRYFALCPRGPINLVGAGGAAWYDRSEAGVIDGASFQASILALSHLVDRACDDGPFEPSEVVVLGFSQGAAMTLALGLRATTRPRPAGIACLSGMLQEPDWLVYDFAKATVPAVYVQHGMYDPIVDIQRGRDVRRRLREQGIEPTYGEYPMQHEINADSVRDLRSWLAAV